MGLKGKIRSMQRGASKRDHGPRDTTPDYQNIDPVLRDADRLQLGANDEELKALLDRLGPKIRAYAKAGFKKPAEVARLHNKERVGTARGSTWSPRLVWFLLKMHYEKKAGATAHQNSRSATAAAARQAGNSKSHANLSRKEMQRRIAALKAHWANS
jgi:hypothetical protein